MNRVITNYKLMLLCGLLIVGGCADGGGERAGPDAPPNILLIVVDDMGFADLGSFGGEIPTPHLDALAEQGVKLSQFITAPACSPTRAMLLSGVDSHLAGLGNLAEELAPNQKGMPGYEGYLNERVAALPALLQDAGYRTYMTGKWHLGLAAETGPKQRGFDRAFAMLTNASHFSDMQPAYSPDPDAIAAYRDNGELLQQLPPDFEYSSQFYVDRMIDYLEDGMKDGGDSPFFAYLAFSAPHWPLQAPAEAIAAFKGAYDEGYDATAAARLARQKRLGLIPPDAQLAPPTPEHIPWRNLSPEQRNYQARLMEVYAAMLAELDRHTGRLIDYLKQSGQYENTAVFFLSDNGAEGHDFDSTWPEEFFPDIRQNLLSRHDFSYENLGLPNSYALYGPGWARASAPAFRLYKAFPTEGGIRTAAFVSYPKLFAPHINGKLVLVKDLPATILELAGAKHPGTRYRGRAVYPMTGRSIVDLLQGEDAAPRAHADELLGKRSVRQGDWKLIHMPRPYGPDDWQLYNLANDLAETTDLAGQRPEKAAELKAIWDEYERTNNIVLPDWVSGY